MAQFPSRDVARNSYDFRTLGLGYANLGTLLMRLGLPYDSEEGFGWCAAISALMTGTAYKTSAEMSRELGAFPRYDANAEQMGRVLRNHRRAAYADAGHEYEELSVEPTTHQPTLFTQETWALARGVGQRARDRRSRRLSQRASDLHRADRHDRAANGLRHDGDRAGLRAGEVQEARRRRILQDRQSVGRRRVAPPRLQREQIAAIELFAKGTNSLEGAPHINSATLSAKGFDDEALAQDRGAAARCVRTRLCLQQVHVWARNSAERARDDRRAAR